MWSSEGVIRFFYAVNLENGKLIRSVEVEAPIAASVSVGDGVGYVGNMDRAVMAFDLETGEVVWNYRNKKLPLFFLSCPYRKTSFNRRSRQRLALHQANLRQAGMAVCRSRKN